MARKSKVTVISLDCGNGDWRREIEKYTETITFHRKNVPTNHTYKVKRLDQNRLRKILHQADSNYIFFGVKSVLLQYHYEYKFYDKEWFRKFIKYFLWFYYASIWIMFFYIIIKQWILGE